MENLINTHGSRADQKVDKFTDIFESDKGREIGDKILTHFSVGEIIEIKGCEAERHIYEFPDWMELRCVTRFKELFIWYPKGFIVWKNVDMRGGTTGKEFKHVIRNNPKDSPVYIIWRSK